jgi:hypothetical protein
MVALTPRGRIVGKLENQTFQSFWDFYPAYLLQHSRPWTRRLHFAGTAAAILLVVVGSVTWQWWPVAAAPVAGYLIAWVGHAVFEQNRPATFRHPWYSFLADLVMFRDMLAGRIPF